MAASMLQRCFWLSKGLQYYAKHNFTARRLLLSKSYTDPKVWDDREIDPQNLAELASLMDRTYERKFPVSSLTISRFVDNISSREEVEQAEYYLYKFRHSPNCWYLRDWTIHSWFRQCLKHGARDKALYTLKNKVQFGMFADDFTFNLLIDSFLTDRDYKGACSVVEEVMFQEAFELPSTQILSLYSLASYLATKPELKWEEERNLGAALLIVGLKQENSVGLSARLLGCSLLGKVEMSRGIRAVFRQMPLMWTPGYFLRALSVIEKACSSTEPIKIAQEAVDALQGFLGDISVAEGDGETKTEEGLEEEDLFERAKVPEYTSRCKDLISKLNSLDRVDTRSLLTLTSELANETLGAAEVADLAQYRQRLQEWAEEQRHLVQREKETRERVAQERAVRATTKASQA